MNESSQPPPQRRKHRRALAFTPVRTAARRRDGWTPQKQRAFIRALAASGIVATAAHSVGMGVTSAYALRRRAGAESFAAAWDRARQAARGAALEQLLDKVFLPRNVPRFYRGEYVGTFHIFDERMMLAALRAIAFAPAPGGEK
ncbi:MAG: hypothetical protein ABW023_15970 [Sphingomonas sp.]